MLNKEYEICLWKYKYVYNIIIIPNINIGFSSLEGWPDQVQEALLPRVELQIPNPGEVRMLP